jgi:ATP:ADP antiporter, AAA family
LENLSQLVVSIRKKEWPLVIAMFGYFFLVIMTFWVLKPIKVGLFLGYYEHRAFSLGSWSLEAAQAELIAKLLNMAVAYVAVVVFSWLSQRYRRQQLTFMFSGFFLVSFLGYSLVVNHPGSLTVWSFYLFGDLYSSVMVATFFAFLNDSVAPERAKRIYGFIGLGGVVGGAVGSTFVRVWIRNLSVSSWMWVCIGLGTLIVGLAAWAGKIIALLEKEPDSGASSKAGSESEEPSDDDESKSSSNAMWEGARLVFRSRYLLAIALLIGIYEVVSTILDFQFKSSLNHFLSGSEGKAHLATTYMVTNILAFVVQLFFTSFLMVRYGVRIALLVLPVSICLASTGFLIVPGLMIGSLLSISDNAFNYSINQSARETLYVPTTRDEKYKAKAFLDMFVQRFAKVLAVVVTLGITFWFKEFSAVRWLSVLVLVLVGVWTWAAHSAGRQFQVLSKEEPNPIPIVEP